jgi:hypothetical protein
LPSFLELGQFGHRFVESVLRGGDVALDPCYVFRAFEERCRGGGVVGAFGELLEDGGFGPVLSFALSRLASI